MLPRKQSLKSSFRSSAFFGGVISEKQEWRERRPEKGRKREQIPGCATELNLVGSKAMGMVSLEQRRALYLQCLPTTSLINQGFHCGVLVPCILSYYPCSLEVFWTSQGLCGKGWLRPRCLSCCDSCCMQWEEWKLCHPMALVLRRRLRQLQL